MRTARVLAAVTAALPAVIVLLSPATALADTPDPTIFTGPILANPTAITTLQVSPGVDPSADVSPPPDGGSGPVCSVSVNTTHDNAYYNDTYTGTGFTYNMAFSCNANLPSWSMQAELYNSTAPLAQQNSDCLPPNPCSGFQATGEGTFGPNSAGWYQGRLEVYAQAPSNNPFTTAPGGCTLNSTGSEMHCIRYSATWYAG